MFLSMSTELSDPQVLEIFICVAMHHSPSLPRNLALPQGAELEANLRGSPFTPTPSPHRFLLSGMKGAQGRLCPGSLVEDACSEGCS